MSENIFQSYRKRLTGEAWLRSVLFALVFGFGALFISAFVFWLLDFKKIWLGAVVFGAVTLIAVPCFYFFKYKPTDKSIAMRIDALGLDERMLTREHLKNVGGFMAERQAADALGALFTVSPKMLSVLVSVPLIVGLSVSGVLSTAMTTISVLTAKDFFRSGSEIYEELTATPIPTFELTYEAEGDGVVEGAIFQIVEEGQNAEGVMAIADDEFAFVGWSDGVATPYREDKNITGDINVTAIFMPLMPGGEGMQPGESGEEGEPGEPGDGQPSDQPPKDPSGEPSPGGGKYMPANQIIDGQTYYGDSYGQYYEDMLEEITKSEDISDEVKDVIGSYFDAIE